MPTGLKTTLKIGTNTIGKLNSINGIELSTDAIETTTLGDDYRTFTPGLSSVADLSIEGYYEKSDTGQVALRTALDAKTVDSYTITFPNGATWAFSGFVMTLKSVGDATLDGALGFSCTIKVSGEPVFTEAV